jgi:hypothetical protein
MALQYENRYEVYLKISYIVFDFKKRKIFYER